ncbi:hypothetical protein GUJ93_ZPchr0013g35486 [Zizania palustris]|uniref:Uncharacterized protein n=1 Tax=Zizania palustris TaxID=103762 RepID=A0A8J5WZV5_ZIZPA|nr:hypothetical protein GUJ93_ZPchr0013g35486 [Zizania palustris]
MAPPAWPRAIRLPDVAPPSRSPRWPRHTFFPFSSKDLMNFQVSNTCSESFIGSSLRSWSWWCTCGHPIISVKT